MTKRIQTFTFIFLSIAIACGSFCTSALGDELPSAFNGSDFTGWQVPANNIWWSVVNEEIRIKSGPKKTGSELWTNQEYANFVMECEFKFGEGVVDSGIFIRNPKEQIQIGISGSLKRDLTASPYIAGKGYPVEAEGVAELLKLDDWNTMTVVAIGSYYSVWLNQHHVMDYTSETATEKGPIGIQLHPKNEMSISFRNIRIAELD